MSEYLAAYGEQSVKLGFVVRHGFSAVRDPLKRSRLRWFSLAWIITIPTVVLGGAFTLVGKQVVVAKGPFAIYAKIPGDLHTHGAIMLLLGLALLAGITTPIFGYPERMRYLNVVLKLLGYYYGWATLMFCLAPAVKGGTFSLIAVCLWGTVALLPMVLLIGPPPPLISRDESNLIRAAVAVGISPAHARALNEVYFHGGDDAGN